MKNILFISGHTDLKYGSYSNKTIFAELHKAFPKAEYTYLDQLYPDYKIDILAEQKRLLKADIIVFQFPINWYHTPSLLAKWIEQTLEYGFAYGEDGDKLKGKKLILSYTSGSPEESYSKTGYQGRPIEDYLLSINQTAKLCKLDLVGQVYSGGMVADSDPVKLKVTHDKAISHAQRLIEMIQTL